MSFGSLKSDSVAKARAKAKAANLKIKQTVARPKSTTNVVSSSDKNHLEAMFPWSEHLFLSKGLALQWWLPLMTLFMGKAQVGANPPLLHFSRMPLEVMIPT